MTDKLKHSGKISVQSKFYNHRVENNKLRANHRTKFFFPIQNLEARLREWEKHQTWTDWKIAPVLDGVVVTYDLCVSDIDTCGKVVTGAFSVLNWEIEHKNGALWLVNIKMDKFTTESYGDCYEPLLETL